MTTVINNKNIAIYMDVEHWIDYGDIQVYKFEDGRSYSLHDLKYHSSWDWLIPVIDKIKSDDMYPKYVDYSGSMVGEGGVYINTKFINVTYDNVMDFINWYNEQ